MIKTKKRGSLFSDEESSKCIEIFLKKVAMTNYQQATTTKSIFNLANLLFKNSDTNVTNRPLSSYVAKIENIAYEVGIKMSQVPPPFRKLRNSKAKAWTKILDYKMWDMLYDTPYVSTEKETAIRSNDSYHNSMMNIIVGYFGEALFNQLFNNGDYVWLNNESESGGSFDFKDLDSKYFIEVKTSKTFGNFFASDSEYNFWKRNDGKLIYIYNQKEVIEGILSKYDIFEFKKNYRDIIKEEMLAFNDIKKIHYYEFKFSEIDNLLSKEVKTWNFKVNY